MSIDSIETLLHVLRRTQLFDKEQLEEIVCELVPHFSDPFALGEYLVEIDWLTAYQLQLILAEQWDELTIGGYHILDRLGEGGMSEVFKAWDTERGRVVALKALRTHLSANATVVRQFQRELEVMTRLSHPNIIKTFDAKVDGDFHYFAMEFIEGMDLDRYLRKIGPLRVDEACDYVRQVAQGLQHAHQLGLVHRDIKPANLFLVNPPLPCVNGAPAKKAIETQVKIIDWGLARMRSVDGGPVDPQLSAPSTVEDYAGEKGSLIGTADYIAPEQARDPTLVDVRADIYSLGCVLYYLLVGRPPFQGATLMEKLLQHQKADPPSLKHTRGDVPDELEALIHKMLAKKPEERPQIPLLVVTPLRRFSLTPPPTTGIAGLRSLGAPGTSLNLPRPATAASIERPGTRSNLTQDGRPVRG